MSTKPEPKPSVKILIAEDDLISRRLLEKRITDWGYDVLVTENGGAAWEAFLANEVGIAILDWMMPEISGIDLCRMIRRHRTGQYTYIILLTSKTDREDVEAGFTAGADDYITKPFESLELKARLNTGKRIIDLLDELHRLAIRDSLTQMLNRRESMRILGEEFDRARREKQMLSIVMLDIDHFKQINDTYGHPVGDEVLIELAARLQNDKRSYDKVGRVGGEEFLAVLPNNTRNSVKEIAERYRHLIGSKPFVTAAGPLKITVSLGCASTESPGAESPEQLIEQADKALYHAKNKGRNRVDVFAIRPKGQER